MESISSLLHGAAPLLAAFAPALVEKAKQAGVALPAPAPTPNAPAIAPPGSPEAGPTVAEDPDVKAAVDYVVQAVQEHRFRDALTAIMAVEELREDFAGVAAHIMPGVDPTAYWFGLKRLDDRITRDAGLDFIRWLQEEARKNLERAEKDAREGGEPR